MKLVVTSSDFAFYLLYWIIDVQCCKMDKNFLCNVIDNMDFTCITVLLFTTSILCVTGRHLVAVEADGQTVKGSPFPCNVYNVNNIKVTGLGPAKVS